jgi:uncharacterized damage-inducible protein DinB
VIEWAKAEMTVNDLQALFDYGYWANRRLFGAISRLTPEQFTQSPVGGGGSICNTMVHMMSAEWGWIARCSGPPRGPALNPADFPTPAALIERWDQVEALVRGFLSTLREEDLALYVEFSIGGSEPQSLPVGSLLQHAANHGVHHRGQVSLRLRRLGLEPEDFDLLFYHAEKQRSRAS